MYFGVHTFDRSVTGQGRVPSNMYLATHKALQPMWRDGASQLCDHSWTRRRSGEDTRRSPEESMFRRRDRRDKDEAEQDAQRGAAVEELDDSKSDDFDDDSFEDEPEDMSADLESQAADYLAGNDVWMYGPSADVVLEILDRLEELTPDEARPIAEAWLAIPKSDREQARKSVRKIYETDPEMARHLQMAREAVGTWMAVKAGYPEYVNAVADWARICAQTGEAALDAATAVILEETLEESHFEALYTPWSETTAELDEAAEAAGRNADVEEDAAEDEVAVDTEDEVAFGPNAVAVADFLNRLWLITPEQVGRLVGGWQNAPREELSEAHAALQAVVDDDPVYRDQVRNAQEKLAPWLNSGRIQETSSFLGQSGQGESRKMAGPALADAIAALVVGDLLDPIDAGTLYAPWDNLIGAPPLPEPAADEKPKSKAGVKAAAKARASTSSKSPAAPSPKPAARGMSATAGSSATTAKGPATTAKAPATTAKGPAAPAAKPAAKPAAPAAKPAAPAAKPAAPAAKPAAKPAAPAAKPAATPKTSTAATPEAKAKPVAQPNSKPTRK